METDFRTPLNRSVLNRFWGKGDVNGIEVQSSSGNVYADLGLPTAEKLKIKTGLVFEIRKALRRLELTQQEAMVRYIFRSPRVPCVARCIEGSERKTLTTN